MAEGTLKDTRGEMMNGSSVTNSSKMSVYFPSRLRMRSHVWHVSGSSFGGNKYMSVISSSRRSVSPWLCKSISTAYVLDRINKRISTP